MKSENHEDASTLPEILAKDAPDGVDRRAFMMRSAMVGGVAVLSGCAPAKDEVSTKGLPAAAAPAAPAQAVAPALAENLDVVKKAKGPGMTTIDEFYKIGPGPSSSHTIGPMHHLGMTCDPVAGYVQIPCIERCAFGTVKAWTGFLIASNEIPADRRVDFDTTVQAMALTAKEMNSKYKETSEGGLAVSVVLC